MRILFVHQNFPGQYRHLAAALAQVEGNEVVALGVTLRAQVPGVRMVFYKAPEPIAQPHPFAARFGMEAAQGEAAARAAAELKAGGFSPDVVCAHSGWGEALFLKDVWPDARLLTYAEWYHRTQNSTYGFDPEFPISDAETPWRLRALNATFLLSLEASDCCLTPTRWQWSKIPEVFRDRTRIIHDGIDTRVVRPDHGACVTLGRTGVCRPEDEIITFVSRTLEPHRGFHVFMRALPEILVQRPHARAVIVGSDTGGYGARPPPGARTWREFYLRELGSRLDLARVHFVGLIDYAAFIQLLQISAAHVYLTYPFVLSWSVLEAMAAECLIVASRTPPVEEVICDGHNGFLVDFFSPSELGAKVVFALKNRQDFGELRAQARKTICERYDLTGVCLPAQLKLVHTLAESHDEASETRAFGRYDAGIA